MRVTYVVGVMFVCCALVGARSRRARGSCSRPNENFNRCGSPCKEKTCEDVCVPGCYCKPGHARDSSGRCFPEDQCRPIGLICTGQNEYYTSCGIGCGDRSCGQAWPPLICPAVCIEGCFCKLGYARDATERCIPAGECPINPGMAGKE